MSYTSLRRRGDGRIDALIGIVWLKTGSIVLLRWYLRRHGE